MLLPWSKEVVISIAQHSVSIQTKNRRSELACTLNNPTDANALIEGLGQYQSSLKSQCVRFVVSNYFMRYAVLPWSPGVTSRDDWLALAEQAMRAEYGNHTENWVMRVDLANYGQAVIAAAMKQSMHDAIFAFAKHFQCKIKAIEPLLMPISRHHKSGNSFLIAEPGRLLFCQLKQGEVQRFVTASPPESETIDQANQLIQRHFLLNHHERSPVVNYFSSSLMQKSADKTSLQETNQQKTIVLNKQAGSHSCWMTGL